MLESGSTAMDQDQSVIASGLDPLDHKIADKEGAVNKLVKLRAFNIFASKTRDAVKGENPGTNGHEIKRIVGQKWARLADEDKQEFIDEAQNENDLMEQLPVDPNAPKRKRRRRTKAEVDMDDGPGQHMKKKGKPRNDGTNGEADINVTGDQPMPRKKRKLGDSGKTLDPAYAGKAMSGAVDGSFDAGYLVTVRVGDTDLMFRGVLFEPSIGITPNEMHDLAPSVKLGRRSDVIPPGSASSSKQILGGPGFSSGTLSLVK